ncbi:hypothetical protein LJK87_39255 [Paenibacillus sp. P25]|nr:hypothetical protein LJK87_39255 [Paenibacillus sp. P25]
MDDFKKDLQNLSVSDFNAGEMVPAQYQGQPFAPDARLCVFTCFGIGFGFGRFGFGGCFGRGGCGGCFQLRRSLPLRRMFPPLRRMFPAAAAALSNEGA